jgi:hypothetical protein
MKSAATRRIAWLLVLAAMGRLPCLASAQEPLHQAIDRLISAAAPGQVFAPQADDAEFLRRVYLDFAGCIPTADAARTFLADPAPDKRARLIDELLAGPRYAQRMQELFHVNLMERRGDHDEWADYLRRSFQQNKPWDQLVRELLNPDATNEATRAAAFFYTKRLEQYGQNPTDYPGLTRDVGRLFLGLDLQCAQCHNHLFIDEYKQPDFQGLYAVYLHTFLRTDVKFPAVGEKPLTQKLEFVSVFDPTQRSTGPRLPGGAEAELPPPGGEAPPLRPLAWIAQELPRADNPQFARNIANRLWAVMLGRGLVHPLDLHHAHNPPSHPELLELLARELVRRQFDMKWFLRELALSQAYQRASRMPPGEELPPPASYRVALQRRLSAEQLLWSTLQASGELQRVLGEPAAVQPPGPALKDLQAAFVQAFANPPREPEDEIHSSVKGALFWSNDDKLLQLLQPRPGNLVARLSQQTDQAALADELYFSVLTRPPTGEERAEVAHYLQHHAQRRSAALGELAWALLSSVEFFVNH